MDPIVDRLEWEHRARRRGLPTEAAQVVGRVTAAARADQARRTELFEELVAHFEDGLAAGEPLAALVAEFGDPDTATTLIAAVDGTGSPVPAAPPRRIGLEPALLLRELRLAFRRLTGNLGFTALAAVALAFGIGAMTSAFSLINTMVLRPWPIADVDRVYDIFERQGSQTQPLSNPDLEDLARGTTGVFSAVAGVRYAGAQWGERDAGPTTTVSIELVTGGYFDLIGIRPALGRWIGPGDDLAPGGHPVVVLGHRFWLRSLRGDPAAIGGTVRLNGRPYTIIGVAGPEYRGNVRAIMPDLIAPMAMINVLSPNEDDLLRSRDMHGLMGKARLRAGVTLAAAEVAVGQVATDLERGPWKGRDAGFRLVPTRDTILYPDADPFIRRLAGALLGVVGLLLLVICANLAGFLLARGVDRRREIAVQRALGATRARVVAPLVLESLVLAAVGGLGGVAIAMGLGSLLADLAVALPIPIVLDATPDWRVVVFAFGVSAVVGVTFGLVPALHSTAADVSGTLRDESAGGGGRRGQRLRRGLVIAQVGVSLLLVVGTASLAAGARTLGTVDPGFGRDPTAVLAVAFPATRYPVEQRVSAIREAAARLATVPGVEHVGVIDNIPLNAMNTQTVGVRNPEDNAAENRGLLDVDRAAIDSGYFRAAGIGLVDGRDFLATDGPGLPVVIIDETLAKRFWPGQRAVGRRILTPEPAEVVGVVRTIKVRSLTEPPRPMVYFPLATRRPASLWFLARTTGNPEPVTTAALAALKALDPELVPTTAATMTRHLATTTLPVRIGATVLSALAVVAMALAIIGLAGTVRYAVAQRRREVGIRMALGATGPAVVRLLAADGLRLVAWGVGGGSVLAIGLAIGLARLVPGVPVPLVVGGAALLMLAAVAVAAWLPARAAARVPPATALRADT